MLLVLNLYVPANKGRLLIKISTFEMKLLDDNGINNYERIIYMDIMYLWIYVKSAIVNSS